MEFFEAAADWADRHAKVITFERDEVDGWFARVVLSDSNGEFSANLDAPARIQGRVNDEPRETSEEYATKVWRYLDSACQKARNARNNRFARFRPVSREAAASILSEVRG